jgi:hypothetical protein
MIAGSATSLIGTISGIGTPESLASWAIAIGGFLFAIGNAAILIYHRFQGAMRDEYLEWARAEVEAARIRGLRFHPYHDDAEGNTPDDWRTVDLDPTPGDSPAHGRTGLPGTVNSRESSKGEPGGSAGGQGGRQGNAREGSGGIDSGGTLEGDPV